MPFGTPDDVRRTIKEMIDLFAPGLVLAPTHVLEPDVPFYVGCVNTMNAVNRRMEAKPREADGSSGQPTSHWENIVAFFDAIEEFGQFG